MNTKESKRGRPTWAWARSSDTSNCPSLAPFSSHPNQHLGQTAPAGDGPTPETLLQVEGTHHQQGRRARRTIRSQLRCQPTSTPGSAWAQGQSAPMPWADIPTHPHPSKRPTPITTTLTAVRVPGRMAAAQSGGSFFLRPFGAERTPSAILGGSGNRSADQPISQARIIAASDLPCICALTWACFFNLRVTGISILSSLRSSPALALVPVPVPVSFGKPENRCVTAQKYTPYPDTSIFIRMNCNTPWWNFAVGRNIDRRWRTADGLDRLQSYFTRPKNHFGLAFEEAALLRLGAAFTPSEILGGSGNSSSDHPITQARIIAASERPCIWALAWAFFFILLETGTTILSSLTSSSSSSAGELGGYRCGTAASIRDNILIYAKAFQCIRMNSNVWE